MGEKAEVVVFSSARIKLLVDISSQDRSQEVRWLPAGKLMAQLHCQLDVPTSTQPLQKV